MTTTKTVGELRKEAVAARDEKAAEVFSQYRLDCEADDAAYARLWDDVRAKYEADMARLRAMPKPDHAEAAVRRGAKLAAIENELASEIRELFLRFGISDERYGT